MNWNDFAKYNYKNKLSHPKKEKVNGYFCLSTDTFSAELCKDKPIPLNVETELGEFIPKLNGGVYLYTGLGTTSGTLKVYENDVISQTISLDNATTVPPIYNLKAFHKYKITIQATSHTFSTSTSTLSAYIYEKIDNYIV